MRNHARTPLVLLRTGADGTMYGTPFLANSAMQLGGVPVHSSRPETWSRSQRSWPSNSVALQPRNLEHVRQQATTGAGLFGHLDHQRDGPGDEPRHHAFGRSFGRHHPERDQRVERVSRAIGVDAG